MEPMRPEDPRSRPAADLLAKATVGCRHCGGRAETLPDGSVNTYHASEECPAMGSGIPIVIQVGCWPPITAGTLLVDPVNPGCLAKAVAGFMVDLAAEMQAEHAAAHCGCPPGVL